MKISYNWLKQYIQTELEPGKMSEILTSTGLEVEGSELYQTVRGGLEGIVIGEVVSCEKHPDADKLSLTKVDAGTGKILQIVCGAPNVEAGQKVPVALTGAVLYKGVQSFKIEKTKIRGEVSEGMICAEDELGIGDSHDGIMVLDKDAVPGTPASEYFSIETDTVFEIGLTPNRIDAASHFGVARDLAAWLGQDGKVSLTKPVVDNFRPDNNNYPVEIIINDPVACTRYSGLTISGVKVGPSPHWLKNRLKAIGLKPINNIVDITNYVLHETGQPLHAFNADKIKGRKVIVGQLPERTRFLTLDEEERELSKEDLMICNAEEGMCIAGVLGGIGSGVNESTENVFLESACFDPVSIRKTARRHGLGTDASFRFERGTDPSATVYVLKRAALLIKEIAGGQISSEVTDVYPKPAEPVKLDLELAYINRLVGEEIPRERIKRILTLLDFIIINETPDKLSLEVPLYRVDVTRPADIVEEILRIYGYNTISVPKTVHSTLSWTSKPDKEKYENTIAGMLTNLGFNEIISNSLTSSSYYKTLREFPEENLVKILNPLSNDLDSMRQTLLYGGIEAVVYNANRKSPDLKFYEFGNVYRFTGKSKNENELTRYSESRHLALFLSGAAGRTLWNRPGKKSDFYDIKGYVEQVFRRLGIDPDELEYKEIRGEFFLYGLQIKGKNEVLAKYGCVHPDIAEQADLKSELFYADIHWDNLVRSASTVTIACSELPRFPEVKRDLAMELDKEIKFGKIRKIAFETEKKLLKKLTLFDIYEGDKIEEGKKSYAISFILQDMEGTLKDKEIDAVMEKMAAAFEENAGARIRR